MVGLRADAGGGRVLRGGRLYHRWRRGLLWLARGLTQAAGADREVGGLMPLGDVAIYDWSETDAGDGRVLRGGTLLLLMTSTRLTQATGAGREVSGINAAGDVTDWLARRLSQATGACCEAGDFDAAG